MSLNFASRKQFMVLLHSVHCKASNLTVGVLLAHRSLGNCSLVQPFSPLSGGYVRCGTVGPYIQTTDYRPTAVRPAQSLQVPPRTASTTVKMLCNTKLVNNLLITNTKDWCYQFWQQWNCFHLQCFRVDYSWLQVQWNLDELSLHPQTSGN